MAAAPIPFRTDPVISTDYVMWIVIVTVGLLMLVGIILLQLHRRGWLDAWSSVKRAGQAAPTKRWQVQSQRISRRTTVHTLHRPGCEVLVVESAQGVTVTAVPHMEQVRPEILSRTEGASNDQ